MPFATPGLVWNTMMSMSGGWFFVVASEAVSVGDNTWKLPGIGSYVALALEKQDIGAVVWAILAMLVVILAYDQLLFRPLVAWSAKFRFETTAAATAADPWVLRLMRRTRWLSVIGHGFGDAATALGGLRLSLGRAPPRGRGAAVVAAGRCDLAGDAVPGAGLGHGAHRRVRRRRTDLVRCGDRAVARGCSRWPGWSC